MNNEILLRDICETLPSDPNDDNTVCIEYDHLARLINESLSSRKIQELEKQLACVNKQFSNTADFVVKLEKQLAESVPKSEIRTILNIHTFDSSLMPVRNLVAHLKELLTLPAKGE